MIKSSILMTLWFMLLLTFGGCGEDRDDTSDLIPETETSTPLPEAGKVTLWARSEGYDSAVFLPADYGSDPNKLYPLILSLHGYNGSVLNLEHTEVGGERTGFIKQVWDTPLAQSYSAVIVAPHVYPVGSNENAFWDHNKLRNLIEDSIQNYQIDPNRIVVTGHSAGSFGAQELALRSKDLVAGIMPGAFETLLILNPCAIEDLPTWVFGNSSDPLFQPASWRDLQEEVGSCPNYTQQFQLSIYENNCGHDCWDDHWARPEVQNWLINQVKR